MEIERLGGQVLNGLQANRIDTDGDRMSAVWTSAASRNLSHRAEDFILATGGLLGGGIIANYDGKVEETVCGLPVSHPGRRDQWLHSQFLTKKSHPIFLAGIECDDWFRPIGNNGLPLYRNLYAVGNSLSGFDAIQERSHEGVALVSSFMVGQKYL
jgi:glycerol-3-phosphate dehydrogenase subunit B